MSELTRSNQDLSARLRSLTPARIGLGRTGVSQETRDLLDFQRAHAQARDAVHARLDAAALAAEIERGARPEVLRLHSAAASRAEYLQRPDLGRRLDEASRAALEKVGNELRLDGGCDVAIVIVDGLSALAVERHAAALLDELLPQLPEVWLGPISIVEHGRVAVGDEIGFALGARIVVVLIGERPGLSSPDSLGVYITWAPKPGRTDAERNCISNIRAEGLSYALAADQLAANVKAAKRMQLTGVGLKMDASDLPKAIERG